jgi:DNA polymerase I-like protein with 3'-5' exonuclease and polymerase domains
MSTIFDSPAYEMERDRIHITNRITAAGVPFNRAVAQDLYRTMEAATSDLAKELQRQMPPHVVTQMFTPKKDNRTKGYVKGVPFPKRQIVPFNPNSSKQIVERFMAMGWQPSVFTDTGEPSAAAAVLAALPYAEARTLTAYRTTDKRMGMLSGEKGWLTVVDDDNRLRTNYYVSGTVTGRCSHSPNIAQVPRVQKAKDGSILVGAAGGWGFECRSLFTAPRDWLLVGADMAGLELRCLAHCLAPFDVGAYAAIVCDGDPHSATQTATGLASRETAKTLSYAVLYGAGDLRAGRIVDPDEADEYTVRTIGREVKQALISGIAGFADLFAWIDRQNQLYGLDGRPLFVRKKHVALNTLLQNAGAVACKRWLLMIDAALQAQGLRPCEEDYEFLIWCHDEVQIAARNQEIAEIIAATCREQATNAGEFYNMQCPLAGDCKIGLNWAMTH